MHISIWWERASNATFSGHYMEVGKGFKYPVFRSLYGGGKGLQMPRFQVTIRRRDRTLNATFSGHYMEHTHLNAHFYITKCKKKSLGRYAPSHHVNLV